MSIDQVQFSHTQPSYEEISQIIVDMVTQAKSNYNLRNRTIGNANGRPNGMFIKKLEVDIKQPQEKEKVANVVNKVKIKRNAKPNGPSVMYKVKEKELEVIVPSHQKDSKPQHKEKPNVIIQVEDKDPIEEKHDILGQKYTPIDMSKLLSHITVKVPLLEMMRIQEHRMKALDWVNGVTSTNVQRSDKNDEVASLDDIPDSKAE